MDALELNNVKLCKISYNYVISNRIKDNIVDSGTDYGEINLSIPNIKRFKFIELIYENLMSKGIIVEKQRHKLFVKYPRENGKYYKITISSDRIYFHSVNFIDYDRHTIKVLDILGWESKFLYDFKISNRKYIVDFESFKINKIIKNIFIKNDYVHNIFICDYIRKKRIIIRSRSKDKTFCKISLMGRNKATMSDPGFFGLQYLYNDIYPGLIIPNILLILNKCHYSIFSKIPLDVINYLIKFLIK